MGDALFVHGGVTDAQEARLALAGLIAVHGATLLDARTGVMHGAGSTALVTGTTATAPMTVSIAPHQWVTTRGTANGPYLGSLAAATTVTIAAAPASGTRVDVVYVKQNDPTPGVPTPDTSPSTAQPIYGVLQGTVGAGKPSLATIVGAEELATVAVSAGATRTTDGTVLITNTARLTVARGARIPVHTQAERDALTTYPGHPGVRRIDLGTIEDWTGSAWITVQYVTAPKLPTIRVYRSAAGVAYNSSVTWFPVPWDGYDTTHSYDPNYAGSTASGGGDYFGHNFTSFGADRRIVVKKAGLYLVEHESSGSQAPLGVRVNYLTVDSQNAATITGGGVQTSTVARLAANSFIGGSIVQPGSDVPDGTNGFRNHLVVTRLSD